MNEMNKGTLMKGSEFYIYRPAADWWLAGCHRTRRNRKKRSDLTETRTLTETKTSSRRNKKFGRDFLKICGNLKIISINGMEKQNEGWMICGCGIWVGFFKILI